MGKRGEKGQGRDGVRESGEAEEKVVTRRWCHTSPVLVPPKTHLLNDMALVNHGNNVGALDGRQAVRDNDSRPAVARPGETWLAKWKQGECIGP